MLDADEEIARIDEAGEEEEATALRRSSCAAVRGRTIGARIAVVESDAIAGSVVVVMRNPRS